MNKYIITVLSFLCIIGNSLAQTEAQEELKAYTSNGLVTLKSNHNNVSFRIGGRVMMDGAHYFDEFTDRGSGAKFSDARIRMFSTIGEKVDFKFELDVAPSSPILRDVYMRWHLGKNSFLKAGNFTEPFSYQNIQSLFDQHFINRSATLEALGTGRTLGISYRNYSKYIWGEAGLFSQKYNSEKSNGDMGYAVSGRLVGRYTTDNLTVQLGGSINHRRPDANGFINGSDDYNRFVNTVSVLESNIDKTPFMGGKINNVKHSLKYGFEGMVLTKRAFIQGEYVGAKHTREKDWAYEFQMSLGTIMTLFAPTLEAYKALFGEDTPVHQKGYHIQVGYLLFGDNYAYNKVDAFITRPKGNSLELVARYNHTDLNDYKGGIYLNGAFYESSLHAAFGLPNGTFIGGKADTFTLGMNYYVSNSMAVKLNYSYQRLNQEHNFTYKLDKNLHSVQVRVAYEF